MVDIATQITFYQNSDLAGNLCNMNILQRLNFSPIIYACTINSNVNLLAL